MNSVTIIPLDKQKMLDKGWLTSDGNVSLKVSKGQNTHNEILGDGEQFFLVEYDGHRPFTEKVNGVRDVMRTVGKDTLPTLLERLVSQYMSVAIDLDSDSYTAQELGTSHSFSTRGHSSADDFLAFVHAEWGNLVQDIEKITCYKRTPCSRINIYASSGVLYAQLKDEVSHEVIHQLLEGVSYVTNGQTLRDYPFVIREEKPHPLSQLGTLLTHLKTSEETLPKELQEALDSELMEKLKELEVEYEEATVYA